ncbi:hypothetical protein Hamer_G009006 [Homarus americanus]|uniref:Uncharacterized protein n=1 Tax=Homarus americanus TaxID=6706 RepID=A0A8J5TP47_HOMAM|nr:hypothetical protein Hamer_G009006 [Homarus americanus]
MEPPRPTTDAPLSLLKMVLTGREVAPSLNTHQLGEDVGVRLVASTDHSPATTTATTAAASTTTCGSARSLRYRGQTCLQPHSPSHEDLSPVNPSLAPDSFSPYKTSPPSLLPYPHSPSKTRLLSLLPDSTSSPKTQAVSRTPAPVIRPSFSASSPPPPPVASRIIRRFAPHRALRYRPIGAIKVPQLTRVSENVRRLSPELRLHLQESLQRLQQQQAESVLSKELVSPVQGEDDGPKLVEAQEPPELEQEVDTCGTHTRSPLKTRANSITSDYFSDSGETTFPQTLLQDCEFVLSLDLVDEESQSSRTECRSTSRSTLCGESSSALPLAQYPLQADESRFLRAENGNIRFLLSDAESDSIPLTTTDRENCTSAEKFEGGLQQNPIANHSAKRDFLKLVPETRLRTVKSFLGSELSLQHTSLPACQPLTTSLNSPSLTPASFNLEPPCPRPHPSCSSMSGLVPLSFSLSSLSGSSSPALESVYPARTPGELHTNSLNRRKSKLLSQDHGALRVMVSVFGDSRVLLKNSRGILRCCHALWVVVSGGGFETGH